MILFFLLLARGFSHEPYGESNVIDVAVN